MFAVEIWLVEWLALTEFLAGAMVKAKVLSANFLSQLSQRCSNLFAFASGPRFPEQDRSDLKL